MATLTALVPLTLAPAGMASAHSNDLPAADLNATGSVSVADAVIVAQCIVGNDNGHCPN